MGLLVLKWDAGSDAFNWFSDQVDLPPPPPSPPSSLLYSLSLQIVTFLDYTNAGTEFVYGFLAVPPNICGMTGVFAFTVLLLLPLPFPPPFPPFIYSSLQSLQVVIYFGSIVALLYYYGIMQFIVKCMAYFMQATLVGHSFIPPPSFSSSQGTTATESLNACACIFLGQVPSLPFLLLL